ncbi:MAG: YebC/PmpR family DNA-binding transcriptional regulator [Actinobacteria bacterium]|nr:YebC/PmpR family DNA-binding transcriptional regulator [Actinomycetota bacterium]
MSGHSKWSTIKRKKGANDVKRGKLFAKLIRAIEVAAKNGGADPSSNASLYQAISKAKSMSVPNDNIEKALKRLSGQQESDNFDEVFYEGYGPHGVAILVECLTDNRNRTSADVKSIFSKFDGSTGAPGSVNYLFERKAVFQFDERSDILIDLAIENSCLDFSENESSLTFEFLPQDFKKINEIFINNNFRTTNSEVAYIPSTFVMLDLSKFQKLSKLIDSLEDLDDVQNVYTNFDIEENLMHAALNE